MACRRQPLQVYSAYTLIEIMIAMAVVATLMAAAVPTIRGWQEMRRIREPAEVLYRMVHEARSRAFNDNVRLRIDFTEEGFELVDSTADEGTPPLDSYDLPSGTQFSLRSPWHREWRSGREYSWLFSPGELTEPLQVRFDNGDAVLEQGYHPLTAAIHRETLTTRGAE